VSTDAPTRHTTSDDDFAAAVSAVTSAFGDPTRRDIYLFARDGDQGVTATEVAERFALHPNVARHHLDKLAAGGYLEVTVSRVAHSGAGRPSKRYKASAIVEPLDLNGRRDDLLATLLGRALALLPAEQAEQLAESVGEEYGRSMAERMSPGDVHRSFKSALAAVADALTAHGFAAHAEARGTSLAIISDQGPFGAAAHDHPVMCAVDRGMVRGMLAGLYGETMPVTESSRAMGGTSCVTSLS
jgi:predicted ArsR family transcriptional regulator